MTLLILTLTSSQEYLVTAKGCGSVMGAFGVPSSIYQKSMSGYKKIYRSESNEDIEVLNQRPKAIVILEQL
jgi:hypothetical protein